MRILRENHERLEFVIYPSIYQLLITLCIVGLLLFSYFHPGTDANVDYQTPTIVWQIITIVAIIVLLLATISLYLVPLKVTIDKQTGKLLYRDFTLFVATFREGFRMPWVSTGDTPVKEIEIAHLEKVLYTDDIPEVMNLSNWGQRNYLIGKFCFILDNQKSINVYTGLFAFNRHKEAFKKIAKYLDLPYEEKFVQGVSTLEKKYPSVHVIKNLFIIMTVLAVVVAAILILALIASKMH